MCTMKNLGCEFNIFSIILWPNWSLEYENKPEDWGPENVRWINNSEIEVEKQGFKDGDFRNIGKIYFVKRTNWIEKK